MAHAGTGKNAADLLLAVEAVSLFHEGSIDTVVIASSDRDFSHLAHHLRERQLKVFGIGGASAPDAFREACTDFFEVVPPQSPVAPIDGMAVEKPLKHSDIDQKVISIVTTEGQNRGIMISALSAFMNSRHKFQISSTSERNWRKYLTNRPLIYRCDPRGKDAWVYLVNP
jgi:hypothetical protein